MKHTIEELQFAATVRELVAARLESAMPANLTQDGEKQWKAANWQRFTTDVMEELGDFADNIFKKSDQQT